MTKDEHIAALIGEGVRIDEIINAYLLEVANDLIGDALQDAGVSRLVATVLRTREEHAGS